MLKQIVCAHVAPRDLLLRLACKKLQSSPFSDTVLTEARPALKEILSARGAAIDLDEAPERQPSRLGMVEEFLAQGVALGVDTKLPRVPAVCNKKEKISGNILARDQMQSPTAGDLRQALQELGGATFALKGDVSRAHRLVKVRDADWGEQACRARENRLNTVGSFGAASAAVHWARPMSGLQRAAHYL